MNRPLVERGTPPPFLSLRYFFPQKEPRACSQASVREEEHAGLLLPRGRHVHPYVRAIILMHLPQREG